MGVLQYQSEQKKLLLLQPLLLDALGENDYLPLSISYFDTLTGNETILSIICVGVLTNSSFLMQETLVCLLSYIFHCEVE